MFRNVFVCLWFNSNYIYFVTCLFLNFFKEALNNTGYSVCRLCTISKFLLLQVLGVPCTVLDFLRSHSMTKNLSLNKLCSTQTSIITWNRPSTLEKLTSSPPPRYTIFYFKPPPPPLDLGPPTTPPDNYCRPLCHIVDVKTFPVQI